MIRKLVKGLFPMGLLALASSAQAATPEGWVISMAWSPQYCRENPALGANEPQCLEEHAFELRSLEPRFAQDARPECSSEGLSADLAERAMWVLPNKAELRKGWRQSGACSGMAMDEYVMQLSRARERVTIPENYRGLDGRLPVSRAALVESFVSNNEGLQPGTVVPVCNGRWLREVKFCVSTDFQFESCGVALADQCPDQVELRPHPVLRARPAARASLKPAEIATGDY